jgi:ketosteroid isomerase-like protein
MEETMLRSLAIVPVLAIALVLPAAAQRLTEQEAQQAARSMVDQFSKAEASKDAAAMAALYTEDAVRVSGNGDMQLGREAIEKWYAKALPNWDANPSNLDRVKVVGGDVIVAIGRWSGNWHGENGLVPLKGGFNATCIRIGDTWKAAVLTVSDVPQK